MLTHLHIQNFAIVDSLALDFRAGMTTITGETGAGKSIAIDALGLCLGDRADAAMVRPNQEKAEIVAVFNLQHNLGAQQWLKQHELTEGDECILRRVITTEGRSRAYINGSPVPASQQKSLGQHLINIHGQHAHQLLMRPEHQLTLLDQYAGHRDLLQQMATNYQQWRATRDLLREQQQRRDEKEAQKQLLEYQINELNELNLAEQEYPELEQEHKKLSNCGDIASASQSVLLALSEDEQANALQLLRHAQHELSSLAELDPHFSELRQMVEEACIQVQEASSEIANYAERLEMDPARLHYLDQRISSIMRLARKHQVTPDALYRTHQEMMLEFNSLQDSEAQIDELTQQLERQHQACLTAAKNLSQSRQQYATELDALISAGMHELSMPHGQFHIALSSQPAYLSALGADKIDFQVSTNPGQPMQPLAKVASGGELSRMSLAIQVITAQKVETPSLIFDEVDVGIIGLTAAMVGKMLRKLGESTQVMCVTHLPQVAGSGHQQMFVAKQTKQGQTFTNMRLLNLTERIEELARLLAGSEITERTLANAKELLHPADLSAEELSC